MYPRNVQTALKWILVAIASALVLVSSAQASTYQVLHPFLDKPAWNPNAPLVADSPGNLYGTTYSSSADHLCGADGCGIVFKLTRESGGKWSYSIIHRFKGREGQNPAGNLIFDSSGNLYGTTFLGGSQGFGTVFELSPAGSKWKERVLHSFGSDRYNPIGALTFDTGGNRTASSAAGGPTRAQCSS